MPQENAVIDSSASAVDLSTLAFLRAIREMEAGVRPVDLECMARLAEFVSDAQAHERSSYMRLRFGSGPAAPCVPT